MRVTDRIRSIDTAKPFPWRFLAPLLIGSALNPINSSVIATAMVPVATAMQSSVGHTTVLISALYVVGVSAIGLIALAADPAVVPNRIARKLLRRNGKGSGLPVPRTLDQAGQR